MKKYFILLSAALLALSCGKEQPGGEGDAPEVDPNTKAVTFECEAAAFTDGTTTHKAWKAGDEISVYFIDAEGNAATAVAKTGESGETATFTARIPLTEEPVEYYATYPAGKGVLTVQNGTEETPEETPEDSEQTPDAVQPQNEAGQTPEEVETISFSIKIDADNCDGSFDQARYAAAYCAAGEQMTLRFKAATGMIKLIVPEGGKFVNGEKELPVTGVYVRNKVDDHDLNGTISVIVTDGQVAEFGPSPEEAPANINVSGLSEATLTSGVIYIPCTPTTWTDGVCVRYLSSEGSIPAFTTADGTEVSVQRGAVNHLQFSTDGVVWEYHVSADAAADGLGTSESPMSLSALQALMDANNETMAGNLKFAGTTIVFAEGTYTLTAPLSFPSITKYDIALEGNGAVLDGGSSSSLIKASNPNLTVRNITFQNGKAENGGVANISKGNWTFDNCTFTGNAATTNGGACNITGGSVKVTGCTFSSNTAKTGGAFYVKNVADAVFDGCTFSLNSGNYASVFALNTATVKCDRCMFQSNEGTAAEGGAIFYGTAAPSAYLNSCYFDSNTNEGKGGIIVHFTEKENHNGKIAMNNVTVRGGSSDKGNASLVSCTGHTVICNSTLWLSKADFGCFAMGYKGDLKGAVLVNSIFCNKDKGDAGVGTNSSYNLRSAYNIISVEKVLGSGDLSKYETENCVTGMFNTGDPFTFTSQTNVPGNGKLYTWDGTLDKCTDELTGTLTYPTLAQVEAEILKAEGIGEDFLAWLKSIKDANGKTALEVDIRGVERNTEAMWPGAYQAAPAVPAE